MTPEAAKDRDAYRRELEAIAWLKKEHPRVHDAITRVIARNVGTVWDRFFALSADQYTPEKAVRAHAESAALDRVLRAVSRPESALKGLSQTVDEKEVEEVQEPEVSLAELLKTARKTAPSYNKPGKRKEKPS